MMPKDMKLVDVHKYFEQLNKESSKFNMQACTSVIVNLNNVCCMSYESHLLKLMLSLRAVG